jgi:hypothetical protein
MAVLEWDVVLRLARLARESGEWYLFARLLPVTAASSPEPGEWMAGYVQALAHLGLFTAAGECLRVLPEAARGQAAIRTLADSIAKAPPSLVPWSSRQRRFEANVAALATRSAEAAAAVLDARAGLAHRYELHQARDGNPQIKPVGTSWPPKWLPALDDHKDLAIDRIDFPIEGVFPPALAFEGVGLGWELLEAYKRTQNVFLKSSSAIYVVEPSAEALAIMLHLHDLREIIADRRVLWFVGPEASRGLREHMNRHSEWPIAERYFRHVLTGPASATPVTEVMAEVAQARHARAEALREQITAQYAGRDVAWWSARFAEGVDAEGRAGDKPLRILALTSLHTTFLQYSMRDCLRALERLGHETRLLIESEPHVRLDSETLLRAQIEFEPDLVILLSRMRYESGDHIHRAIPSVTWDQDALPWVFDPRNRPTLAWNDFLMGFAARHAPHRFGWPAHHCHYCRMAGSIDTYSAEPLPDDELAPFRCDVSYVSHASTTPQDEADQVERWLNDEKLICLFREALPPLLAEWLRGGEFPGPVATRIRATAQAAGVRLERVEHEKLVQALQRVGDRAFRHVALGWVADWADRTGRTLHLWGNGWERHPRLARYARGATRNGHELRCVYQASRINLQLIGFGFLHQRALDGLMAGAFFMTRRLRWDACGAAARRASALLAEHGIESAAALRGLPSQAIREQIEAALAAVGFAADVFEPRDVANLRDKAGEEYASEVVPHYDEISFESPAEFAARAETFLTAEDRRSRCAAAMRQALIQRYSYDARMAEMLRFIRTGFATDAAAVNQRRPAGLIAGVPSP